MDSMKVEKRPPAWRAVLAPERLSPWIAAARFVVVFGALSVAFSMLAWGKPPRGTGSAEPYGGLFGDLAIHVALCVLAALPTRRLWLIAAAGAAGLAFDGDHIWAMSGFNVIARGSHALAFAAFAAAAFGLLAGLGAFGRGLPTLTLAALAGAIPFAHMAGDSLLRIGHFPFWAPFSYNHLAFTRPWGLGLFLIALRVMALAARLERRKQPG